MFIAGFAVARYRTRNHARDPEPVAGTSSPDSPVPRRGDEYSVGIGCNRGAVEGSAPSASANSASAEPGWLRRVNYYRAMVKLPPIVEDPAASSGDRAHTTYIVKNYHDAIDE